jgi:hypothetical protein
MTGPTRRPGPFAVVSVALAALLVATLAYDLHQRGTLDRTDASLSSAHRALDGDDAELATVRANGRTATLQLDARQASAATTFESLLGADTQLSGASADVGLQQLDLSTLHDCLQGVQQATLFEAVGNTQAAVNSLTGASGACAALDAADTGGGIAYPFDFPDPFILTVGSEYYGYATNSAAGNIQIIQSSDLTHWTTVGDALPHVASWAQPGATWAPSVLRLGGAYVLYYSAVATGTDDQCISAATSSTPQGPFLDSSTAPVVCQTDLGGSIDPSPYVDASGAPYLTWKSQGSGSQPPTIWAQALTADGTSVVPGAATPLLQADAAWQGGIVEGPDMVDIGGQYELFFSGNDWTTADYAVGVVACAGPLGPCPASAAAPILASQPSFSGPGGETVFTDAQGDLWMAFHAWLPGQVGYPHSRVLFIRRLSLADGVPAVAGS